MFTLELPSQAPSTPTSNQSVCSLSSTSISSDIVHFDISLVKEQIVSHSEKSTTGGFSPKIVDISDT